MIVYNVYNFIMYTISPYLIVHSMNSIHVLMLCNGSHKSVRNQYPFNSDNQVYNMFCYWISQFVSSSNSARSWVNNMSFYQTLGQPSEYIWAWTNYLFGYMRRHQMETISALLAICGGNSPVPGEFPEQRPVTRSFDVFFDLCLNKRLSKQSWCWWFETLWRPLWRHRNV